MYIDLSQALVFVLVMIRMLGMLVTNPILGRTNVPPTLNAGLAFVLAILLTSSMSLTVPYDDPTFVQFMFMCIKELAVGMIGSFILLMFLSVLVVSGEVMDMQLGIGMAKNFDPGTNSSISVSSSLFNAMFILIFFATNNHLTLIRMASQSFLVVPLGAYEFNWNVAGYLPELFSTILIYAMKMCIPIVAMELIVTMAVGMIMRIIPQINVFVVNIQFKLLIGIFSLVVLIVPFMGFLENLIVICFEQIAYVWQNLPA